MSQREPTVELRILFRDILLVFLAALLPGLDASLFLWMYALIPMLVFFLLNRHGWFVGNRVVLCGMAAAFVIGSIVQSVFMMVFAVSLLSIGYALAYAGLRGDSPAMAGLKGSAALSFSWLLLLLFWAVSSGSSPYASMIATFDASFEEAMQYYRQTESMTTETLAMLEETLTQMKVLLPIIVPAILGSTILLICCLTMVMGNRLVGRFCGRQVWPQFRLWHLPERLIWLGILSAVLVFLPIAGLRMLSVNLLILVGVIYSFQGLAVFVFFLHKWNVSVLLRSFLYVLVFFQSIGTVLLLLFGVADVWFDFRKLRQLPKQEEESSAI